MISLLFRRGFHIGQAWFVWASSSAEKPLQQVAGGTSVLVLLVLESGCAAAVRPEMKKWVDFAAKFIKIDPSAGLDHGQVPTRKTRDRRHPLRNC